MTRSRFRILCAVVAAACGGSDAVIDNDATLNDTGTGDGSSTDATSDGAPNDSGNDARPSDAGLDVIDLPDGACKGVHPRVDGSFRYCDGGECYCPPKDSCHPSTIAQLCCLDAAVVCY